MSVLRVQLDTSPLSSGHAGRGIGMYTRQLQAALKARDDIELVSSNPDVVHYPFFDLFTPSLPFFHRTPTVVTIHDVIPLLFPKQYVPGYRGKLALFRQKLALKTVRAVITDSEASKADIVRYLGVPSKKVHVVYLAAASEFSPASGREVAEVKNKHNLPKKYLLYVGDINYNKNLPQLIKALKFLPEDLNLVLVGKNFTPHPIPEWQWIETQVALSDVANRVTFLSTLGTQDTGELAAVYTGAVAYVQPSLYEGFGLPLLEAMMSGTPVVSAHNSSLIEVGGDHAVFAEPTAEALAEAVEAVLSWNDSTREQKITAAQAWSATFSWHKAASETRKIYETCL